MSTHVKVSHRVKALLALGLKSVDEVLEHLLGQHGGEGDADGGERAGRKRGRAAEEEEENEDVPQLFSFETLVQEEKAVKCFTGLNHPCMEWVMKAMADAVRPFVHFRGCPVWACWGNIESRICHGHVTFLTRFLS